MHIISREIGIDMGHRVTYHGSKCRNVHGHRYTIEAVLGGDLASKGEQEGMVLDFGFIKEEMMNEIDAPCDHGLCMWVMDPLLNLMGVSNDSIAKVVKRQSYFLTQWDGGKLYIIDEVPTAENLAYHWFKRLAPRIFDRSAHRAFLQSVKVYETPNCWAEYVRT